MTGIRITPFGMAPKISNLVVDGDLNLGANKLLTNVIHASTEKHGVLVDGPLTCGGVAALAHVVTPSAENVLYSNSKSYLLAENDSNAEADLFSITVPPGYAAGGVSTTVEATINLESSQYPTYKVSGYVKIYVNGVLNCTLSHTARLTADNPSSATKTSTLLGMSSGDVILVRGYAISEYSRGTTSTLTKFEIKGNSGAFVGSEAPTW